VSGPAGKKPKKIAEEVTLTGVAKPVSQIMRSVRLAHLEQVQGPGAPQQFMLVAARTVVGRSDEADVTIKSKLLSRMHASFTKSAARVRCQDLDSSNGLYLNGTLAHAADLYEGDTIQIGDVIFVFREGQ
jgi:pSer/pThr/pTyr-binding forkhead associated (FHA) protein